MDTYEKTAKHELSLWQEKMIPRVPSLTNRIATNVQNKINKLIPEKAHQVITEAIRHMVQVVLAGSEFTSTQPLLNASLEEREKLVRERINTYKKMAAVEGAGTGAGGFLLSLADFPLLLGLKMKLLYDIAGLYGLNIRDYQERVYILYIFQLAFSSQQKEEESYHKILKWTTPDRLLAVSMQEFDWRTFQQEYRDYIDLAKMLQLVPGIGAVIGAIANHQLVDKLGETAIQAYRLRWFHQAQNMIEE
jgi:hypothetical protein